MSTHFGANHHFGSTEVSSNQEIEALSLSLHWAEGTVLEPPSSEVPDLVCLCHLRWDFVYQRPQHLLSRCAQSRRVFVVEEVQPTSEKACWLEISHRDSGVWIVVPHISDDLSEESTLTVQRRLMDLLFTEADIDRPILWYYTPMALRFTHHLNASAVVYDCMDELSAFKGAHPQLQAQEAELFKRADLVFTGGHSLYEVKQRQHPSVHAFPSSIDAAHFAQARNPLAEPADQATIPHPRLGFYGVIDERLDLELLRGIAQAQPDWHLVIVGPVVKIDPAILPQDPNIHYLGSKTYQQLPYYLAGWDVALLPFARNESTRFISPTKTPEYLAGGKPVVSTSIRDVVRPYGQQNLVQIADTVPEFVTAIATALDSGSTQSQWLSQVDAFLAQTSWDLTWQSMNSLIETAIAKNRNLPQPSYSQNRTEHDESRSLSTPLTATAIASDVNKLAI